MEYCERITLISDHHCLDDIVFKQVADKIAVKNYQISMKGNMCSLHNLYANPNS